jgi:hypothetical protein
LTLNVESDKLKQVMQELYVEALSTETEWYYLKDYAGKIYFQPAITLLKYY